MAVIDLGLEKFTSPSLRGSKGHTLSDFCCPNSECFAPQMQFCFLCSPLHLTAQEEGTVTEM